MVPELLTFDPPDLPPQLRAQRVLNKARVPQIARYLVGNPKSYVLSAITASIDADVRFEAESALQDGVRVGQLVIPAEARILVNDGQHRRAAITEALTAAVPAASATGRAATTGSSVVAGLTARESEVLRLLAEGLSDRQIAEVLSISERTAGNHVLHILQKLDVNSRTAAAVFAVRHDIA